ncbi:MAG TPA: phosphatidylcholine/phosphatidylserine synthase [Hyphomicrobiaceae bacterium]|jgi:CDP-diacylglycerol--serine O-phosphatidyltransferase|nr:phosphatidylcholine/phosphatidylserine synthase [Hyphomicrobiaceae bacterium]
MDPLLPRLEVQEQRRRRRLLFRHNKIPVRMLVPNFFTLLSLCAGLTAIRMAIEQRYDLAVALVVIAALLDGVDGRLARALKAQSKFGAELDSLADFVNFGVAPGVILFTWGLGGLPKGLGWIVALVFALATGLRLARFNTMLEVEKPKWQSDYFTGMPAPAGAITVLLPLYADGLGLFDVRALPWAIAVYTAAMAALLVSTIPTYSGKLMGERISGEFVLPMFVGVAALVALLVTYPYATLTVGTLLYLAAIPIGYRRFQQKLREPVAQTAGAGEAAHAPGGGQDVGEMPAGETKH